MKFTKLLLACVLFVLTTQGVGYSQVADKVTAGVSADRLKRYEGYIKSEIDQKRIPGAVSLIMRNGTIVHKGAFGSSNLEDKAAMKANGIFYIQSMTKPIIAVAFMMLYEEGHFMLTDPISKYLPGFTDLRVIKNVDEGIKGETVPISKEITIANLLSHTAGFSHGIGATNLDKDIGKELFWKPYPDIQSRVNSLLKLPLVGQPGEQWYYSSAPDVLSVLIEKFSGMSTNQFLTERIFKPLAMNDTGYNLSKEQQSRVVQVYNQTNDGLVKNANQPKMEGNTLWSGVNGLYSTAADYMNFCQLLLNGGKFNGKQLLSRKTIELMTDNHTGDLFDKPGEGFGLGFAVLEDVAERRLLGSEGLFYWGGAFNTHFFIDPKEKIIAILMMQVNPFTWNYHDKMRLYVYQALVD